MSSEKFTLVTDLDGVVADLITPVLSTLSARFKIPCTVDDIVEYDVAESLSRKYNLQFPLIGRASTLEVNRQLREEFYANDTAYRTTPVHFDTLRSYAALRNQMSRVVVLTARPKSTTEGTKYWVQRHIVGIVTRSSMPPEIHHASSKAAWFEKNASWVFNEDRGAVVYVEDSLKHVEEVLQRLYEARSPNLKRLLVILPERAWNAHGAGQVIHSDAGRYSGGVLRIPAGHIPFYVEQFMDKLKERF